MNPAETPDEPTPTVNPVLLQAKVDQLERQVNDYKLLLAKQKKYAAEPVARDLLAVIDNLERAAAGASKAGEAGALSAGVTATITMFLDVMKRHGVKRIETAPGSPFDPNLHMAVMEQPTNDAPAGSVFQVLEQGYLLHDRVLRPATVIVASAPPAGG
jgi:molecular chaperone GrpE